MLWSVVLDASFSCYSTQTILGRRHFGLHFILKHDAFYFASIEEVDTMSEKYLQEGFARKGGLSKREHFIRAAGDIERYKPPKIKGICVT